MKMIRYDRPRLSLRGFYARRGRRFSAFGDGIDPADVQAVNKALSLMDAALTEAKTIRDNATSTWGTIKGAVTGVSVDAIKTEVDTFEKAAASMHDTATRLLGDASTTHDRIVDFVRGVSEIANISSLKDSSNRNDLAKLAADVAAASAKQIVAAADTGASAYKWLVVGGVVVAALLYFPEVKGLLGLTKKRRA